MSRRTRVFALPVFSDDIFYFYFPLSLPLFLFFSFFLHFSRRTKTSVVSHGGGESETKIKSNGDTKIERILPEERCSKNESVREGENF